MLPGAFWRCLPWSDGHPLMVRIKSEGLPATFNHSGHSVRRAECSPETIRHWQEVTTCFALRVGRLRLSALNELNGAWSGQA